MRNTWATRRGASQQAAQPPRIDASSNAFLPHDGDTRGSPLSTGNGADFVRGIELMGEVWANENPVGTGPFVTGDCVQGEKCTFHALNEHWRKVSEVDTFTILSAAGDQILALLQTGLADFTDERPSTITDSFDLGEGVRFLAVPGAYMGQSVAWAGNLWEEVNAGTGEPLNPWGSPAYDTDLPWIGDP